MTQTIFLDIGDIMTKGICVGAGPDRRLRFPSVVATTLLQRRPNALDLILDSNHPVPGPAVFEPEKYARARSYPGTELVMQEVRAAGRPLAGARMTGWMAAAFGGDRQGMGAMPARDGIEALLHKALALCGSEGDVEVVFVLDTGGKAEVVEKVAASLGGARTIRWWSFLGRRESERTVHAHASVLDAADCAVAAVPAEFALEQVQRILLVDIGYGGSKLVIVSEEGCEHVEQVELGMRDCVHRLMRDGPEWGMVEDEFAVIRALEGSHGILEIAGRRYDLRSPLQDATRGLEEELLRAARRAVSSLFERRGEVCKYAVIAGGGAAALGERLASKMKTPTGQMTSVWVAEDADFLFLKGAQRMWESSPRGRG